MITPKVAGMPADAKGLLSELVSRVDLPVLPSAAFQARRHIEAVLTSWQAESLIDTARYLASELVTNALSADTRWIGLTLRLLGSELMIEVADSDLALPVPAEGIVPDSENGRGLMIVEALSKDWGYYFPSAGGKVVYCVVDESDS